jgi:hypothetical protein
MIRNIQIIFNEIFNYFYVIALLKIGHFHSVI